jgi:catechol 2,3-dioxygenase-like lactoylglutathione lyase family enzyme
MFLLDHVSIAVSDLERARPFYDTVMTALGAEKVYDRADALGYGVRCRPGDVEHTYLAVYTSGGAFGPSRRHWCFKATTRAMVDAFHRAGLAAGGSDDGAPGLRPHYHPSYYAAFVLDPDGNRLEAVCHRAESP